MNSARRGEKRSILLSLGNRKWPRDNLEEKRLDVDLKGGYEVARQRFQCEQTAQTLLVGKDHNIWEAYLW